MSQNKIIGIVLVVVGLILLYFGYNAANAPLEELGESLTGRYSNETMAFLIGGAVALVAGAVMAFKK